MPSVIMLIPQFDNCSFSEIFFSLNVFIEFIFSYLIDDEKAKEENRKRGNSLPKDECQEDMDNKQPTMWLGTEDGWYVIYIH